MKNILVLIIILVLLALNIFRHEILYAFDTFFNKIGLTFNWLDTFLLAFLFLGFSFLAIEINFAHLKKFATYFYAFLIFLVTVSVLIRKFINPESIFFMHLSDDLVRLYFSIFPLLFIFFIGKAQKYFLQDRN